MAPECAPHLVSSAGWNDDEEAEEQQEDGGSRSPSSARVLGWHPWKFSGGGSCGGQASPTSPLEAEEEEQEMRRPRKLRLQLGMEEEPQLSTSRSASASGSASDSDKSTTSSHKQGHSFFNAKDWQRYLHLSPSSPPPPDFTSRGAPWDVDLDRIQIGEIVATGSYGMVHMGVYDGRKVALKSLMCPEASTTKELNKLKAGFRQEIEVWYTLHHPNIVQFIGASITPTKWAIVTEYLDGGSLKSFLMKQQRKKLPTPRIISMALDIARGMEYLHQHNIIHRDLKSANLILDGAGVVKVADFGLARFEAEDPGIMTAETGTIRWMAPEVIGHKPYTRKIDVYSFGIVLWELCTCLVPFEGMSFVQLAHAVANDNYRPPTSGCPPSLALMMTKCWDQDACKRPDFVDLVKLLEAIKFSGTQNIKSRPADKKTSGIRSLQMGSPDPYRRQTVSMRGGKVVGQPRPMNPSLVANTDDLLSDDEGEYKRRKPSCLCTIM